MAEPVKAVVVAALATGCIGTQAFGTASPSRDICNLGAFDQELVVAQDFRVDRYGDHAYPDDASVRRALAADAAEVKRQGVCPGAKPLGTFKMAVHRIEIGASRGRLAKGLMFAAILPTLGFSIIYPMSEQRWLTVELDAATVVAGKTVWTGSFTAHTLVRAAAKELPTTGSELSSLMKKAQVSAASELLASSRGK
ncbi:MAG: hypothetical protein ABI867_23830 [Kofleriaceae bacterium]